MHRRDAEIAETERVFLARGKKIRFAVLGVLSCAVLGALSASAVILAGCSSAPSQRPTQTVAPDSTAAATMKDLQAKVISLAQQNETIINAVQKSAQDADAFRLETKGGIASLTQNQFRFESWWSDVSARLRPRLLGFGGFDVLVPAAGNDSNMGKPDGAGGGARIGGVGNPAPVEQVKKRGANALPEWRPTMLELLIAFGLGALAPCIALIVLLRRHSAAIEAYETKISVIENNFVARVETLIQRIEGKPAAPKT